MPGTDDYGQNVPYPKLSDQPNIEAAMLALVNGVVPLTNMMFANANARAAAIANPVVGMTTYLVAENRTDVYTGSTWVRFVTGPQPPQQQFGSVNISFTNQDSDSGTSVTFPTPFTTIPKVFVNINSGSGATVRWSARAIAISATDFGIWVTAPTVNDNRTWSAIPVQWYAIAAA